MHQLDVVHVGDHLAGGDRGDQRTDVGEICAHVGEVADLEREDLAVRIQSQFGVRHVRAAVRVGEERFAARGDPAHRLRQLARGVTHRDVLRIRPDLHAETAADVAHDDAHVVRRHLQDRARQRHLEALARLTGHVHRVLARGAVVVAQDRARLHRVGCQPVVHQIELHHVRGAGDRLVHRRGITHGKHAGNVAGCRGPQRRCARLDRGGRIDHRRQRFVAHLDALGRVHRLSMRARDDDRDRFADVAHLAAGQRVSWRTGHIATSGRFDRNIREHRQRQDVVGGEIGMRVDGKHPGRLLRLRHVDRDDARACVRRAHEVRVQHAGHVHVIGIAPGAGEQALVFLATNRLPDAELRCRGHRARSLW